MVIGHVKRIWLNVLVCALLGAGTLAAFWPVAQNDFVNYDDSAYITENPHVTSGLTWANLRWAITSGYACNWHPVTWISHMADVQAFGLRPGPSHLVSLGFHVANALLLFWLLKTMTGALGRSAFVAGFFALHPLHVESVAWLAERKDVLSGFFFLLTLLAYTRYVRTLPETVGKQPLVTPRSGRLAYCLVLVFFVLGLMSKPMLVTTPCVLLLLDLWPFQRFRPGTILSNLKSLFPLFREKIPFFLLAALSSVVTLWAQNQILVSSVSVPVMDRFGNAAAAYLTYVSQALWPSGLAVFYPYQPQLQWPALVFNVFTLLLLSAVAVFARRRWPFVFVGWFWYLGMLVPVIGLVQVGSQARADRYTYLPLVGFFLIVVWGAGALAEALSRRRPNPSHGRVGHGRDANVPKARGSGHGVKGSSSIRLARPQPTQTSAMVEACPVKPIQWILAFVGLLWLGGLAVFTHRQVQHWQNSETLFAHAAQVTTDNYMAFTGLAIEELRRQEPAAALTNLTRALEYAQTRGADDGIKYYVGAALQMQGKSREALPYLEGAVVGPELRAERDLRLGVALLEAGRVDEAEVAIKRAFEAKPDHAEIQLANAALLYYRGKIEQAEQAFHAVIASHPKLAQAHRSFAEFLVQRGRRAEAEAQYAQAIELQPNDIQLRLSYAATLGAEGKANDAIREYRKVLEQEPESVAANLDLAEVLCQEGHSVEAVGLYDKVLQRNPNLVSALNNLAWLLATSPDEKVRDGSRAVKLAAQACALTEGKAALLYGTLAAAYAEAGRFADAVAAAEKAIQLASAANQPQTVKRNEELLALYRAGKPFREGN